MSNHRRVVITGMGAVTPLGLNLEDTWQGLVAGKSGVTRITQFDASDLPVQIAAEVKGFDPRDYLDFKEAKRTARFTQLAVAATREALAQAELDMGGEDPLRVGAEIGCAVGGLEHILKENEVMKERGPRRINIMAVPSILVNMAACQIAMMFGAKGPAGTPVAACATGIYAVGDAFRRLQRGEIDVAISGSTEAILCRLSVSGFWRLQALSTRNDEPERACRPFDKDRDGTVMGEGAAIVILETLKHALRRDAPILAEVVGYGVSEDAYHVVAPDPEGAGAAQAMSLALAEAGLEPGQVDYISAHGTATPLNDISETVAIKTVFGEKAYQVPVGALKSMIGHTLGAAGTIAIVGTVKAIQENVIPPTINLERPDPQCDLDYVPNVARQRRVDVAMSNAFGFGGQNASLVVKRYEE